MQTNSNSRILQFTMNQNTVRSIAYDWQTKEDPSYLNVFTVNFGSRLTSRANYGYTYPRTIEFTERSRTISSKELPRSYFHIPRDGVGYEIPTLTADIVVEYKITPEEEINKAPPERGLVKYELTVTDRRDGQKLALLRYVIDEKSGRACGLTGSNVMDQLEFVVKAIGRQ